MAKYNFYAIRKGWQSQAIVTSWEECQPLVNGFKGCEFKGFKTYSEAEEYIDESSQGSYVNTRNAAGNILV